MGTLCLSVFGLPKILFKLYFSITVSGLRLDILHIKNFSPVQNLKILYFIITAVILFWAFQYAHFSSHVKQLLYH